MRNMLGFMYGITWRMIAILVALFILYTFYTMITISTKCERLGYDDGSSNTFFMKDAYCIKYTRVPLSEIENERR